ncbi:MAG: NAD(P)/FAD-dependent oxidoreductase [Bacteroidales bacterium]|nr:NAD(P)/FAD-dependent oxidoreductase [Bacteroidales bacterium]
MKYDVVIIGGGLGGLECGYMLAKKGLSVCIVEKNARTGGCLQNFTRNGHIFDTGFHYVGGLAEGQPLNKIFSALGLLDLPWKQLDTDCFDEVIFNGERYRFANGYDNFTETLLHDCEKNGHTINAKAQSGLKEYANLLKEIGETTFDRLNKKSLEHLAAESYFSKPIYQYLKETIYNELLIGILGGTSLKMELEEKTLPLYTFSQINSSFVQSAWRLRGGGEQIATTLAAKIEGMGGKVLTRLEVTRIVEKDGKAEAVEIGAGEYIEGKAFISNLHPALTLSLINRENSSIKNIFRRRICNLENTFGMFTVNLALKAGRVPYLNRNIFINKNTDTVWNKNGERENFENRSLMVSFQVPENEAVHTDNIDILMPMYWNEVSKWEGTKLFRRGEEYEDFKAKTAEICIRRVEEYLPDLKGTIEGTFTSTPLTYRDYTGTINGSAYGIRKDYSRAMLTVLSPTTPLQNLFLTGQNLNLHGILGVSMTALMTSAIVEGSF